MVRHGLWMIFGGFTHPIYSVYSRYIICFTVPLCPCITGLGSEQPLLLFYLLYSFVPTKKRGNSFFYPPQAVGRSNNTVNENENVFIHVSIK
jgi:hypothetical protein